MVTKHFVYQIVYNEAVYANRDKDFLVLDNFDNLRPDWYEYWPIRRFLLDTPLEEDAYYGFFSPSFGRKTGYTAAQMYQALDGRTEDVVIFSPFLDQSAMFINQIDQAEVAHPGFRRTFAGVVPREWLSLPLIQDSRNTVFSNALVARPRFWRRWLELCEGIFGEAERAESLGGMRLRKRAPYRTGSTEFKVFCIERMASLLLVAEREWTSVAPIAYLLPMFLGDFEPYRNKLKALDRAKRAAADSDDPAPHLAAYAAMRRELPMITGPDLLTRPAAEREFFAARLLGQD